MGSGGVGDYSVMAETSWSFTAAERGLNANRSPNAAKLHTIYAGKAGQSGKKECLWNSETERICGARMRSVQKIMQKAFRWNNRWLWETPHKGGIYNNVRIFAVYIQILRNEDKLKKEQKVKKKIAFFAVLAMLFTMVISIPLFSLTLVKGKSYGYKWQIVNDNTGVEISSGDGTFTFSGWSGSKDAEYYVRNHILGWDASTRTRDGVKQRIIVSVWEEE